MLENCEDPISTLAASSTGTATRTINIAFLMIPILSKTTGSPRRDNPSPFHETIRFFLQFR